MLCLPLSYDLIKRLNRMMFILKEYDNDLLHIGEKANFEADIYRGSL